MFISVWQFRSIAAIFSLRYIGTATALWLTMDELGREEMGVMSVFGHLDQWAAIFLVVGLFGIGGILIPKSLGMRILLTISVGIGLTVGGSIVAIGGLTVASVSFLTFALIDLITITLPLESMGS